MTLAALALVGCLIEVGGDCLDSAGCVEEDTSAGDSGDTDDRGDAADDSGDEGLGLPAAGDCGSGGVSFEASGGSVEDLTATFGAGEDGEPVAWTFDTPGTLTVCEGRWFVALDVRASLQIVGPEGHETTELSGARAARVVTVDGDDLQVSLQGVTLRSGASVAEGGSNEFSGGGLACRGDSTIDVSESRFFANIAARGGAIWLEDCAATLSGIEFEDNEASEMGGALYLKGAAVEASALWISANSAEMSGGGIYLMEESEMTLSNSEISGNDAEYDGGGVLARAESRLELDSASIVQNVAGDRGGGLAILGGASARVIGGQVNDNTAGARGGGVYLNLSAAELPTTISSTEFSANEPDDGYLFNVGSYEWDKDASFSCTPKGCE